MEIFNVPALVPLFGTTVWYTGEMVLRAYLDLLLKDAAGNWNRRRFRVDWGTDVTSLSAADAKTLGLPIPQRGLTVPVRTSTGMTPVVVRPGFLRMRVAGMDPVEHVIPCHFLGDPDAPLPGAMTATLPRSLLGMTGVVDKLRIITDGTPTPPQAPYGNLIVERI
jgi:hypothetical protein